MNDDDGDDDVASIATMLARAEALAAVNDVVVADEKDEQPKKKRTKKAEEEVEGVSALPAPEHPDASLYVGVLAGRAFMMTLARIGSFSDTEIVLDFSLTGLLVRQMNAEHILIAEWFMPREAFTAYRVTAPATFVLKFEHVAQFRKTVRVAHTLSLSYVPRRPLEDVLFARTHCAASDATRQFSLLTTNDGDEAFEIPFRSFVYPVVAAVSMRAFHLFITDCKANEVENLELSVQEDAPLAIICTAIADTARGVYKQRLTVEQLSMQKERVKQTFSLKHLFLIASLIDIVPATTVITFSFGLPKRPLLFHASIAGDVKTTASSTIDVMLADKHTGDSDDEDDA